MSKLFAKFQLQLINDFGICTGDEIEIFPRLEKGCNVSKDLIGMFSEPYKKYFNSMNHEELNEIIFGIPTRKL